MAEYEIIPSPRFKRQLKKLPEEVQERIAQVERLQRTTPFPQGYDIRKMKGERKLWRIRLNTRHGSFRYVFLISHRERVTAQATSVSD